MKVIKKNKIKYMLMSVTDIVQVRYWQYTYMFRSVSDSVTHLQRENRV